MLTRLPYFPLQEATACGVKVTDAKRVLKLMQALEAAQQPSSGIDSSSAYRTLATRLGAAEQGGVSPAFMQPAKAQLRKLLMADVKKAVETALKIRPGRRAALKTGAVRDALDQAESLLESGLGGEAEPFLSSAQNWRALHVKTGVNGELAGSHAGDRGDTGSAKPVSGDLMAIPDAAAVKRMLGEAYRSATSTCTTCRCSSACHVCFTLSGGVSHCTVSLSSLLLGLSHAQQQPGSTHSHL